MAYRKLGRETRQRRSILAGLTKTVILNGFVVTTEARAKEVRKFVDKMITYGKRGTLVSRRSALAFLHNDKEVVSKIIEIETGDEICSSLELPALNDPQKIGSAITYYRRYTLQSLLGIQAEDDDANKASGKETKKEPISTRNEPEKWLNVDSEEWNALAKLVENGTTVKLAQVRKKYKVSKETQKALESLNIF